MPSPRRPSRPSRRARWLGAGLLVALALAATAWLAIALPPLAGGPPTMSPAPAAPAAPAARTLPELDRRIPARLATATFAAG